MTCQVILEFKVKPDAIEKVCAWMRKILPDTRAYEGFVSLSMVQNQDDPTAFAVVEQWDARKNYEKYIEWRGASGALAELSVMLDGEPSFRFFDYVGV